MNLRHRHATAFAALGAVLASITPALAASQAAPAGESRLSPSTVAAGELSGLRAFGVAPTLLAAAARAGGVHDGAVSAEGSATAIAVGFGGSTGLVDAGDLDADGIGDVVDVRYVSRSGKTVVGLLARTGGSGSILWTRKLRVEDNHLVVPVPAAVGTRGRPGVLVLDTGIVPRDNDIRVTVRILALNRHGHTLWTHTEAGRQDTDATMAQHHVPFPVGGGYFVGRAFDVLIARVSSPDSTQGGTVAAMRVAGADGIVDPIGAPVTSNTGTPTLTNIVDLSGDGHDDVLFVVPGEGADAGVHARRGVDGGTIWSNTTLALSPGAGGQTIGDVHDPGADDPLADVAVSTGAPGDDGGLPIPLPFPDPTSTGPHGEVALLDGVTGDTVWSQSGDFPYEVHKAGPDLAPAVGVLTSDLTSDDTTTTETLTLATYDDSGAEIYSTSYSVSTPTDSTDGAQALGLGVAIAFGDLEPDSSLDGLGVLLAQSGQNTATKLLLLRGKDGAEVDSAASVLGGSVRGQGDDLVSTRVGKHAVVKVRSGADLGLLFRSRVPHSRGLDELGALGARLHASRCADVLVTGTGAKHSVSGVLASDGSARWTTRFPTESLRPGRLDTSRPAPRPSCG